jgi:hypothetical protein
VTDTPRPTSDIVKVMDEIHERLGTLGIPFPKPRTRSLLVFEKAIRSARYQHRTSLTPDVAERARSVADLLIGAHGLKQRGRHHRSSELLQAALDLLTER